MNHTGILKSVFLVIVLLVGLLITTFNLLISDCAVTCTNHTGNGYRIRRHTLYQPIQDIHYGINVPNDDRSVYVVPRRAYFDNRPVNVTGVQKGSEIVVVLAEVHEYAIDSIIACKVNGYLSESLRIFYDFGTFKWGQRQSKKRGLRVTHIALVIQCIGLSREAILNGSVVKLIYKMKGDKFYSRVESEMPLFLHGNEDNADKPTKGKGSIVVCATMYGTPDRFDQWVKYQEYLGVDRVHVNAHSSFGGALRKYRFFKKSLGNGFVHLETWNNVIYDRSFYHNQFLKYQDCFYRHIGIYEYAIFYDYDDFFNPVVPNKTDIHYYLSEYFTSSDIGSVRIPWYFMKCKPKKKLIRNVPHGNLTSILSGYSMEEPKNHVGKSVHQLLAHWMIHIHYIWAMRPGYREVKVGKDLAYIAHNRISAHKC